MLVNDFSAETVSAPIQYAQKRYSSGQRRYAEHLLLRFFLQAQMHVAATAIASKVERFFPPRCSRLLVSQASRKAHRLPCKR